MRTELVVVAMGALVFGSGCTEGDDPKVPDAGDAGRVQEAEDAGEDEQEELDASAEPMDSGALDAAREASATASCGTPPKTCTAHVITSVGELAPGCALNYQDAEVCGISSQHVLMGEAPKFLEKNAKGVASPSCGAFYDALEGAADGGARDAGGAGNGRVDKNVTVTLMGVPTTLRISYPGCCTERGFCSADGNKGMSEYGASMSGFGCMESSAFFRHLPAVGAAGSAGAGHALRAIPCDPDSGVIALPDLDAGAADAGDSGAADASADAGDGG
ncbi:MAG TPA: hypothetical protein VFZ61_28665 [Polyangiales bacterium]